LVVARISWGEKGRRVRRKFYAGAASDAWTGQSCLLGGLPGAFEDQWVDSCPPLLVIGGGSTWYFSSVSSGSWVSGYGERLGNGEFGRFVMLPG
jgi:hypothetical protein